jgi:hypothetical protein
MTRRDRLYDILFENFQRGYVSVEVDRDRKIWRSDFRVVETVQRRENVPAWTLASWIVEHGKPGAPRLSGEPSPTVSARKRGARVPRSDSALLVRRDSGAKQ